MFTLSVSETDCQAVLLSMVVDYRFSGQGGGFLWEVGIKLTTYPQKSQSRKKAKVGTGAVGKT